MAEMTKMEREQALADRLKNAERGAKHDAAMLIKGFSHGVMAREEMTEKETQSA